MSMVRYTAALTTANKHQFVTSTSDVKAQDDFGGSFFKRKNAV